MCLMTTTIEPADKRKIRQWWHVFAHGYGDNGFAYLKRVEFFRYVLDLGVVNMESRGHGRSDGMLGLVPSFETE